MTTEATSATQQVAKKDKYVGTIRELEGKENYYYVECRLHGKRYKIRFLDDGSSIRLRKSTVKSHPVVTGKVSFHRAFQKDQSSFIREQDQKKAFQGICTRIRQVNIIRLYPTGVKIKREKNEVAQGTSISFLPYDHDVLPKRTFYSTVVHVLKKRNRIGVLILTRAVSRVLVPLATPVMAVAGNKHEHRCILAERSELLGHNVPSPREHMLRVAVTTR